MILMPESLSIHMKPRKKIVFDETDETDETDEPDEPDEPNDTRLEFWKTMRKADVPLRLKHFSSALLQTFSPNH